MTSLATGCAVTPADESTDDVQAADTASVPAAPVTIKRINANGSGCPTGSVVAHVSDDKQRLSFEMADLVAEAGPGLPLTAGRKNCAISVVLNVPPGYQFALDKASARATVSLETGIKAELTTGMWFEGSSTTTTFRNTLVGPTDVDVIELPGSQSQLAWSPCAVERALSITPTVRAANTNRIKYPEARGLIGVSAETGAHEQSFTLKWRRCP